MNNVVTLASGRWVAWAGDGVASRVGSTETGEGTSFAGSGRAEETNCSYGRGFDPATRVGNRKRMLVVDWMRNPPQTGSKPTMIDLINWGE